MPEWTCQTCTETGRRGYCAPGRCYCGHEECHASASYRPLERPFAYVALLHPPNKEAS